jgi:nucleoside-diphosphate-sugar epimerase
MEVNLLGGNGFVGGRYCEMTPNVIKNDRDDFSVKSKNILYFISTVHNYNIFTDPYLDIDTNLITLIKVLENCKNKDVTFNFISSWFVYGNVDLPARENSYCDPKGFYSITKRTAEQLLISYCETFGIKYRILRLANILGESDKKVSKQKNALQFLINEIKENKPISLYNGGDLYRDYIYVDDAIDAINLILDKGDLDQIYNVGNGEFVNFKDIIYYAKDKLNSKSEINSIEVVDFHKKVQTKDMVLDISKIKSLGYVKKYSIYNIIDKLII